ncbi:hypothetical protein [Ensifer soli]|uniref:hypothetical protein n=1 Tax=Ciceribacter sp. sgz301302 TaxID=3342379 RepID=UPI0035BAF59C
MMKGIGMFEMAAAEIEIVGDMAGPGVECPLFRLESGEVITLSGPAPKGEGAYALTGRFLQFSNCMQGRTFRIQHFRPAKQG